jgi:hypothetical protein
MSKAFTLVVLLSLFGANSAEASLLFTSPTQACKALNDVGLKTGVWKKDGDEFGCNSSYKEIGRSFPLANNLAYYADGTDHSITQVYLVLNVNDRSQASSAHSALLKASHALSGKAVGVKLLQAVADAIAQGRAIRATIHQATVEVIRKDWPTGNGYELHVIFR